jgi:sugar phosphate isomerase/epimerase
LGVEALPARLKMSISRRTFISQTALAISTAPFWSSRLAACPSGFRLRYIVATALYGKMELAGILPEVPKLGATHMDLWPLPHGNQREQMEELGHARTAELLEQHQVKAGVFSCYNLGPFGLQEEMRVAAKFGARLLISNSRGPRDLRGEPLKAEVKQFAERMKPHIAAAEENGVIIGIENHSSSLIASPDSIRRLMELCGSRHIGIALAPYHLDQDPAMMAGLIEELGERLVHFYAWQHGKGSTKKLPKEEELLQMPGRGDLDFVPLLRALRKIGYDGWTEPFMHPMPRGIPILETREAVTAEIRRAQEYLEACLRQL